MTVAVVLLTVDGIDQAKQWARCLEYAGQHDLRITAYATDPASAASVVNAGNASLVLACVQPHADEPACLAGRIRYVRPPARPRPDLMEQLGRRLLKQPPAGVSDAELQAALTVLRKALETPAPGPQTHTHPGNVA